MRMLRDALERQACRRTAKVGEAGEDATRSGAAPAAQEAAASRRSVGVEYANAGARRASSVKGSFVTGSTTEISGWSERSILVSVPLKPRVAFTS